MASLVDFYKQKLAPVGQKLSSFIDRDKSMAGVQLAQGGLFNQLTSRGIIGVGGQSLSPVQVRPAQQFVSGALKPAADAVGTFGKLSFDAIVKQPARNRQMQIDTQKAIDASNRALQTAKATREAGRPDLAAQMTRSMIPQLQAESQRFTDIGNETQAKQKALVGSGVRTGLYASALLNPVASLGAGALSTGLGATFAGQTSPEQLGTSFGEGVKYGGMPNPVVKGGLLTKSAVGGLVNLAEDAFYAKTVEGRNLTPKEIALSLALPAAFESMGALNKVLKTKQKVDVTTTPEGLTYNKEGKLFDPISGQFAKTTEETRIAVQHVKDFISAGGKPVRSQTRLIETAPNKWVDEQDLQNFDSTIDTPKLSVEPTKSIDKVTESASKYGWTTKQKPEGIELISQNGKATILITEKKNGQYKFSWPNGEKLMDGRGQIGKSTENLIEKMFYGKQLEPSKPLSVEPTPEQARANFQKQWQDTYGNRPTTEKIERPVKPYVPEANLTMEEARKVARMTDSELADYNRQIIQSRELGQTGSQLGTNTKSLPREGIGVQGKGESVLETSSQPNYTPVAQGGLSDVKKVTPIRRPLKEVYKEKLTTGEQTPLQSTPQETIQQITNPTQSSVVTPIQQAELPRVQPVSKIPKLDQPSESIIQEARKQIGVTQEPSPVSTKQSLDNLYTQWVDRYNPLTKASQKAQGELTKVGAVLRPENDPTYLVRRLTGAGGIADARFRTELNPILKEMETFNIPKSDMDVYLANKRMAGFGKAGRDIYGTDPVKAGQVVSALEAKYPQISGVAQKMYLYQDKGLNEIAQAGFLSPEAVANLKSQNPDYAPLYRVMDEMDNYLGLPTRKTMQGTSPISKIKGSTRQIESPVESIIGNTFRQRAAIEKNRVAQSVVELQNITDMGFSKVAKSALDTITVWKNGQKEYWKVGQEIADTAKGVNEESMNLVLKVLQAPASLLRQGATGRNPEFMIPNIIRDNIDAGISSKYGYVPFVDFVSGLKSMLTNDDVYKKWESSGAKIDLGELSGKKEISALFNEKTEKRKLFSWLGDTLDFMGKYSEQPTRVGLFKKAYQKTGNELIAAMESRDATVDFARMGSKMKVANSIIPFLNVGVQGFDKLIRNVKGNPGKLLLAASTYAVAPQIMSTMYNLIKYPEEYKEVPQYEKDANFVFIQGRNEDGTVNYVTIPKGNITPTFANPTQNFLEYAFSNDPQSFKEMALSTLTNALPVVGKGSSLKEIGIKTIGQNLPQAFKPITENLLNKSFYKYDAKKEQTKDIVPTYLQNKLPYQQKYDFTPKMYQKIGAVLNASPLKVQNLMEGYLAGYSKIPAQIIQSLDNISQGKEVSTNDKTILRRFVKTTYPSSSKPAPEKQPTPSLMERVTGKVGAAETSTKKVIPQWKIDSIKETLRSSDKTSAKISDNLYAVKQDNGDIGKLDLSRVINMPSSTNYETVKKETEKWKVADDILKLDPTDQVEAFKQLGISKEDAEYYTVAKDTTEAKAAYIKDQVQGVKDFNEFATKIAPLRKEINGEKILSDGVIDWMYNSEIITSAQKKQLKSLEYDNINKVAKVSTKKGTTKVKKITAPKLSKFNLAGKVKQVKRIRTKQYKLKI